MIPVLRILPVLLLLLPAAGRGAPPSRKAQAPPAAETLLNRFYPRDREKWFQGLWIPLKLQDPPRAYRLFLTHSGWARLQSRGRGPQEWQVLGPRGAWRCGPGKSLPLRGAELRRLSLLARGLALLALWPLGGKAALLQDSPPGEPRFLLPGGRKLRIRLDEKGLPRRLFLTGPLGKVLRVLVPPKTERSEEPPPWPARAVLQDGTGGPALKVKIGRIRPCLLTSPSFFSPPGGEGKKGKEVLPPGFRPGAIKLSREKAFRAAVLPDPGTEPRRLRLLVETGKTLKARGWRLQGLPFFVHGPQGWEIWIPLAGEGAPPEKVELRTVPSGLYASLYYQGPPQEPLLLEVRHLAETLEKKGLQPDGPVQIGLFLPPGGPGSLLQGEEVLARIRVRVKERKD